ncbi:MAG: hypothetical protein PHW24_02995 [Candidatus Moranbacteria bacterium]|nr:hypothetical protein [Candidatus Moranbacteria bacterium]
MKKQRNKKRTKKSTIKPKKIGIGFLTLGNINPQHGRILTLIVCIIFVTTAMTMRQAVEKHDLLPVAAKPFQTAKPTALASQIKTMVQGYPIEQMTPYIVKQDPKTAMFLVAIAKKESAWGKRHPVLNGEDCYNYWGFRLKSEKMGSGGHTCFDSPEQAVNTIAQRIDELVKEEKIDTPKEMVVWKCGYGCQDRKKDASEIKWIKDVDYYYNELLN